MRNLRRRFSPACLGLLALLAPVAPAEASVTPLRATLDNGLRVTILADPTHPVVATQVWYHVGSANEGPGSRGLAHLFEHLMFGPTKHRDREAYARHHHRAGGYDNAYTSWDETVYVSEIAPEHHEPVLAMEAERMVDLVFTPADLENEKRIVTEELRLRTRNDPFTRVMVTALEAVLGDHPYAHTPAGTPEDIAAATPESCRRFYAEHYGPANAHLVVVGPVDGPATLAAVRRHFGALGGSAGPPPDVPPLPTSPLPGELVLREDLPPVETALTGFVLPPAGGPDTWSLRVLQELLTGGSVDPFEEILVERRDKAVYAETTWLGMRRGGAVIFASAQLPYRRKRTAFRLIDEARDELGRLDWLTDEAVESAKRALLRRELNGAYFAERRADAIGRAHWWLDDERLAFEAPDRIRAVTRDEVARVFRRYVIDAEPVRLYLKPERVPWYVRLFGWLYPLVSR